MWKELHIRRYLWEVSRELPGSRRQKKTLLRRVENSVREFASEASNTDYRAIVKWFGPPEKIAESYVEEMDAAEILQGIRYRKDILFVLLVAVAVILTARIAFVAKAYNDYEKDINGYAVVEVIEIERLENMEGDN